MSHYWDYEEALEFCICAALRCKDGTIIRGHRHPDCFHNLSLRPEEHRPGIDYDAPHQGQGFITSRNRFVNRYQAMELQKKAGIKSCYSPDGELRGDILFSEDLY